MKLELDPVDLAPEFQVGEGNKIDQRINTRDVTFDKLNEAAQTAVKAVGKATYYAWDRQTYNAILLPN